LTGQAPPSAQARFLDPNLLIPPRRINPAVSPETEAAVLSALALHPHQRPASVEEWQATLASKPPPATAISTSTAETSAAVQTGWQAGLRDNLWLIGIALILLVLALVMTFGTFRPQ
jgi:serine/threonine-protein kinase